MAARRRCRTSPRWLALAVHNFLSAATGIAIAFALIRGFARRETRGIGNFWADLTRITLYILLPICVVYALVLVVLGMPQTLAGSVSATTMEGAKQVIALGPGRLAGSRSRCSAPMAAASSTPTPRIRSRIPATSRNMVQMLSIFALGAGLTWTFGKAVGNTRQGWAILAAMMILFTAGVTTAYSPKAAGNPIHHAMGVDAGGNMEGKEVRFGTAASALFATSPRRIVRRGQLDARQLHAARRPGPAVQHPARRGRHRRRRRRASTASCCSPSSRSSSPA